MGYVDNTEGFFLDLKPINGAIKAFEFLAKHFETYILTTAPWKNTSALTDKRKWVGKYLRQLVLIILGGSGDSGNNDKGGFFTILNNYIIQLYKFLFLQNTSIYIQ